MTWVETAILALCHHHYHQVLLSYLGILVAGYGVWKLAEVLGDDRD